MHCMTNNFAHLLAFFKGLASLVQIGRHTRISVLYGESAKGIQVCRHRCPRGFNWKRRIEQIRKVVSLSEGDIGLLQERFEVFLGALLGVKAYSVVVRMIYRVQFALSRSEVSLGFVDPLTGDWLHTRCGPS